MYSFYPNASKENSALSPNDFPLPVTVLYVLFPPCRKARTKIYTEQRCPAPITWLNFRIRVHLTHQAGTGISRCIPGFCCKTVPIPLYFSPWCGAICSILGNIIHYRVGETKSSRRPVPGSNTEYGIIWYSRLVAEESVLLRIMAEFALFICVHWASLINAITRWVEVGMGLGLIIEQDVWGGFYGVLSPRTTEKNAQWDKWRFLFIDMPQLFSWFHLRSVSNNASLVYLLINCVKKIPIQHNFVYL